MKLIDVINEQPAVGVKYKWKDQPEHRGARPAAPARQDNQARAALGSQKPEPSAGKPLSFTQSAEHRGARPSDPRAPQQQKPSAEQQPDENQPTVDPEAGPEFTDRYKFTGQQAKLGKQIINFASRMKSASPQFGQLMKIVQQEEQRRKSQMKLVPKEQQGA